MITARSDADADLSPLGIDGKAPLPIPERYDFDPGDPRSAAILIAMGPRPLLMLLAAVENQLLVIPVKVNRRRIRPCVLYLAAQAMQSVAGVELREDQL